ncbi:heat shock protein Hsp90 [Rozella allomycis CSF55]|uniref:Endoplasmin domain-containing protein n=1 Tax=Rozella allomycis (strain CSF55) TaxID=988480 RepID=A0A075B4M3_ROZAC|nr:Endoplasmin domain-containing protein [Rozella allomycis CSF55]RKP21232.1 heat shock protein Hsp90 [Rozella allomycis CSF55]|eukprot:EPZ36467.1 Endoplasmin domain-containing protein [Rozella allomycis CSF55]
MKCLAILLFVGLVLGTSVPDYSVPPVAETTKHAYQTEVSRMMKLIVNSLYKSKEIFLRELISNASDALEKIRTASLRDEGALGGVRDLNITIAVDQEKGVLMIRDTGIGMTKEQLRENLGTIAKSGTAEFFQTIEKHGLNSTQNFIGQFGVGFYSAFLVADEITVVSKNNEDEQYVWQSREEEGFSISKDVRGNTLERGTMILLHMKEDAKEFLEDSKLRELIKKHSEFINFPIYLYSTKTIQVDAEESEEEVKGDDQGKEEEEKDDEIEDAEEEEGKEEKKEKKKIEKKIQEYERINDQKPIWMRDPKSVEEEEYKNFYKAFKGGESLGHLHFKAEGDVDFRVLLFIPKSNPFQNHQPTPEEMRNIKLFVKRVFITEDLGEFLPKWLTFITGVVDCDEMPLNVSRETLQQNKILKMMKNKIIQKVLDYLNRLKDEDEEKYESFYKEYSSLIKVGVMESKNYQEKLLKLIKFSSSFKKEKKDQNSESEKEISGSKSKMVTLEDYVKRMKKGQKSIFYLAADSIKEAKKSPLIEKVVGRGYEVLYFIDYLDEFLVQNTRSFQGFEFVSVAKEGLEFGDEDEEEKKEIESLSEKFKPLIEKIQEKFKDEIEKVVISSRLVKSPSALVSQKFGISPQMQKIQEALYKNNPLNEFYAKQKKIFEINPSHPLIVTLLDKLSSDESIVDQMLHLLYETTSLRSGYKINDEPGFAKRIEKMMRISLQMDLNAEPVVELKQGVEKEEGEGSEGEGGEGEGGENIVEVEQEESEQELTEENLNDKDIHSDEHEEL